ncbi:MAG TPA: hypothetical protein PL182_08385 [Pseudobdellovibrionaceae bacterium]|nr:hypothetical protein [Pseudobdellovibrionaceae bacterium]
MILVILCSGALLSPAVQAQTTVVIQLDNVLCSLLPQELQGACYTDVSYDSPTRGAAIRVCSNLSSSYYRNECYGVIEGAVYSYAALNACGRINNDYAAVECMRSTRNGYYQTEAMDLCSSLASSYYQGECFKTVRGKVYDRYELEACGRELSDYNRSQCMERFGRRVNTGGGGSYPVPYPRDPRPIPQPIPQDPASCEVHNSSSYITTVSRSRFLTYAKQFARENKSCVVSNNYNEERTRTLIDEKGRVLGSGLTEREANDLKSSYGYNRCRILTCK